MKIVDVQLETHHENPDAVAYYTYVATDEGKVNKKKLKEAVKAFEDEEFGVDDDGEEELDYELEERPNKLSEHTGLRRFYVRDYE